MQGELHVRLNGRSYDYDLSELGLSCDVCEQELRQVLARLHDLSPDQLEDYVIVREKQAIIVRPIALYG